jgi:hypothetical protein
MSHVDGAWASVRDGIPIAEKWALCAPLAGHGLPAPWPWQEAQVTVSPQDTETAPRKPPAASLSVPALWQ